MATQTYNVRGLFPFYTYRQLVLLAEKVWITADQSQMVWITADQSQINLDFSPVRMVTMWLLRTPYIAIIQ